VAVGQNVAVPTDDDAASEPVLLEAARRRRDIEKEAIEDVIIPKEPP
jgi:hypothetical protein